MGNKRLCKVIVHTSYNCSLIVVVKETSHQIQHCQLIEQGPSLHCVSNPLTHTVHGFTAIVIRLSTRGVIKAL